MHMKSDQWKNHDGASSRCTTLLFMYKNSILEHWPMYHSENKKNEIKLADNKLYSKVGRKVRRIN